MPCPVCQTSSNTLIQREWFNFSEEPERIRHPKSAAHFRRKLLDERQVVAIERVAHVKEVKRDDVRAVVFGDQVRTGEIRESITRGRRLGRKNAVLVIR